MHVLQSSRRTAPLGGWRIVGFDDAVGDDFLVDLDGHDQVSRAKPYPAVLPLSIIAFSEHRISWRCRAGLPSYSDLFAALDLMHAAIFEGEWYKVFSDPFP